MNNSRILVASVIALYSFGLLQDHLTTVGMMADDGMGGHTAPYVVALATASTSVSNVQFITNAVTGDEIPVIWVPFNPTRDWWST